MPTTQEKIEAVKIAAEVVNDQDRVTVEQIVVTVKEVIKQTDQAQQQNKFCIPRYKTAGE